MLENREARLAVNTVTAFFAAALAGARVSRLATFGGTAAHAVGIAMFENCAARLAVNTVAAFFAAALFGARSSRLFWSRLADLVDADRRRVQAKANGTALVGIAVHTTVQFTLELGQNIPIHLVIDVHVACTARSRQAPDADRRAIGIRFAALMRRYQGTNGAHALGAAVFGTPL